MEHNQFSSNVLNPVSFDKLEAGNILADITCEMVQIVSAPPRLNSHTSHNITFLLGSIQQMLEGQNPPLII